MNRETYRQAFDNIPFSPDFQTRTAVLLQSRLSEAQGRADTLEERSTLKEGATPTVRGRRAVLLTAALIALLALSVSAAVLLQSAAQVAERVGEEALTAAFQGEDAVLLNTSATVGDYTIIVMGLVSGEGLTGWDISEGKERGPSDRTYLVYTVARADGAPLSLAAGANAWQRELTVTPLAAGYGADMVNIWTLADGTRSFAEDGVTYHVMSTQSLEIFADQQVYLAACIGGELELPAIFPMGEDGSFTVAEGAEAALIPLPLDSGRADPEAAAVFLEEVLRIYRETGRPGY